MPHTGTIPQARKEALRAAIQHRPYTIAATGRGTARGVPFTLALAFAVATLRGGWALADHGAGRFAFRDDATGRTAEFTPEDRRSRTVGPCGCACSRGGWCGGCGHAGCGGRRR